MEILDDVFECAEGGEIKSMMFLAAAFKEGYFSPGLSRYAAEWCEKAAGAGEMNAMLSIASFYRWGEGEYLLMPKRRFIGTEKRRKRVMRMQYHL